MIRTEEPAKARPDETVIVVPVAELGELRAGFDPESERVLDSIFQPGVARGMPRSLAEIEPAYKQLVGYVILRRREYVFNYQRVRGGGETRLTGFRSLGLGGHLNLTDVTDCVDRSSLERSIRRELQEEAILTETPEIRYVGILNDDRTDVSRVHLGIVVVVNLDSTNVTLRDPTLADGRFDRVDELNRRRAEFEDWSKHCLAWLRGERR